MTTLPFLKFVEMDLSSIKRRGWQMVFARVSVKSSSKVAMLALIRTTTILLLVMDRTRITMVQDQSVNVSFK